MKIIDETKRTKCMVYSRCCGWFVPVREVSNKGKVAEFGDRKLYIIKTNE